MQSINDKGYELVNKSQINSYIIGRDYNNVIIYGYIEILTIVKKGRM